MKTTITRTLHASALALAFSAAILWAQTLIEVPTEFAKSISVAMIKAKAGDTILVGDGTYRENIIISPGVVLKARHELRAKINGQGRGIAVTMGKNSTLSGFVVCNGTIGVFSNGRGSAIVDCRIERKDRKSVV